MPYVAQEQICLDEARKKIVPCDSPEARSNLALPGAVLDDEVAAKYGLIKAAPKKASADEEPAPDKDADKDEDATVSSGKEVVMGKAQAEPPANKAKNGGANK